jgi:hypothetical protein
MRDSNSYFRKSVRDARALRELFPISENRCAMREPVSYFPGPFSQVQKHPKSQNFSPAAP